MRAALADLRLDRLFVVFSGDRRFPLAERIDAIPLREVPVALRDAFSRGP